MGEILLIRHGETAWNREQVFRGRRDVSLGDRGREQARLLAERLAREGLEAVYSSPLSRSRETAQPVAEAHGLPVRVEERLTDMSYGEWEGRQQEEVKREYPELYRTWVEAPQTFRPPGGERLSDVAARAWPAMGEIGRQHRGGRVAIVTHRVVCKLLLCSALGAGEGAFWRVRVDTASISVVETGEDLWVVTRVNDTHHLRELGEVDRGDF
jgi:broad specificity phosphatase PhoE